MRYVVSDFRNMASMWFNEFLPEAVERGKGKAGFVEDAGVVYVGNMDIESLRKPTMQFVRKKIHEDIESKDDATFIYVQEPKPVNNIRIRPALKLVECNPILDDANRTRILHLANRRYVVDSSTVYVSQNKEMDEFLASIFSELGRRAEFPRARFYPIQSLGVSDFLSCAYGFFPRKVLEMDAEHIGQHSISIHSANDICFALHDRLMKGRPMDSTTSEFVERCRKSITQDLERLV